MFKTLKGIFKDLKEWRSQVFHLALIAMQTSARGTALGWLWIFLKPGMYIFCFWFTLYLGIKGAHVTGMTGGEYLVWLSAGIIPWFFMQSSLNTGSNVFTKYSYLVTKLKFPIALIPIFYELSLLLIHIMLLACLMIGYLVAGGSFDLYFLQLPLIIVMMYIFFAAWSLLTSPLTAISKDLANAIKTMMTPIFWLSGVLFDTTHMHSHLVRIIFYLNPITFFTTCYRRVFVYSTSTEQFKGWIWENPEFFFCGLGVLVLTVLAALFVFSRLRKEVPDVL